MVNILEDLPFHKSLEIKIFQKAETDRYGQEKSCRQIAYELNIDSMTVWRTLKAAGYNKTKPTRKLGLTVEMRMARWRFCQKHKDWTIEEWKAVIWTDETSVVLGHWRGGYRIWQCPDQRFLKSTMRERWKGHSEFMFWGCSPYDSAG